MGNKATQNYVTMLYSKKAIYHKMTDHGMRTKCGLLVTGHDETSNAPPYGHRLCGNCARAKS